MGRVEENRKMIVLCKGGIIMQINNKFVDYENYCEKCKNSKKSPTDDPCNECLTHPVNDGSRKPVCFEEVKE